MESLPLCSWYFGGPGCDLVSPADSSNPNPIIDSEQVRLGKCAERESLQRMKSYSGFADDSDDELKVNMKWLTSISREGVSVESSAVIGSFWQAIRATTEIRGEKMAILNLLMDDSRIREYDDVFDFSQVIRSEITLAA